MKRMDYKKKKIPKALREQVWIQKVGKKFEAKCKTSWCSNKINVFDFQAGHDVPESKGGTTDLENLVPICARCNLSMGSQHTFKEWSKKDKDSKWNLIFKTLLPPWKLFDTTENGTKSKRGRTNLKSKPMK
jgi:5-methylcytosine-specific restriction endonuclease McrA